MKKIENPLQNDFGKFSQKAGLKTPITTFSAVFGLAEKPTSGWGRWVVMDNLRGIELE